MYTLKNQLDLISGGACIDVSIISQEYIDDISETAHREAFMEAGIIAVLTGAACAKLLGAQATTALLPLTLASLTYQYSYVNNELWPWNY